MFKRDFSAITLATLMAAAIPLTASAFTGRNGTRVAPVSDKVYEVVTRGSGSGQAYWCGAADYARRVLKAPWSTRIYVVRGAGPSLTTNRRSAVHFTIDPDGVGIVPVAPSISLNKMVAGDSMSLQQANTYCTSSSVVF